MNWRTGLSLAFSALISAIIAALAAIYYTEYDVERAFCGNIFDFEDELPPNRFVLVRYLYVLSISLNYLLPVTAAILYYSEVLEALKEFDAPIAVIEEAEKFIRLDGHLLLWLGAPIHMLESIQLMHWKRELLHGKFYAKVFTMLAGAYCIMQPTLHIVLNMASRNE
ncbi:unnamed protein product [Hydatigera taeniaeformis]|uniref:Anoctamin n=1 Tax=Hydatigena taeniaeformis TaxID=6205 RepID=A0A0R3WMN7_HYDTA|nr:unnamed protein product [Hydatigera taeniaeformis]